MYAFYFYGLVAIFLFSKFVIVFFNSCALFWLASTTPCTFLGRVVATAFAFQTIWTSCWIKKLQFQKFKLRKMKNLAVVPIYTKYSYLQRFFSHFFLEISLIWKDSWWRTLNFFFGFERIWENDDETEILWIVFCSILCEVTTVTFLFFFQLNPWESLIKSTLFMFLW